MPLLLGAALWLNAAIAVAALVSTTHSLVMAVIWAVGISVGAVFGVRFLREYPKNRHDRLVEEIKSHHPQEDQAALTESLA